MRSQSLAIVIGVLALSRLAVAQTTETSGGKWEASLSLQKEELQLGEPIVATVTVANRGPSVATVYARSSMLRKHVPMHVIITDRGGKEIGAFEGQSSGSRILEPAPALLRGREIPQDFLFEAGGLRRVEKVILPTVGSGDERVFLPAGEYRVRAAFRMGEEQLRTEPVTLKVKAAPDADELKLYTPSLQSFIEGSYGRPSRDMQQTVKEIRARFPNSAYRPYLEYRMLDAYEQGGAPLQQAASEYLKSFADSPFADDVLWKQVNDHLRAGGGRDEAIRLLKEIIARYPDSPLQQEAAVKLAELGVK